ncbi:unnamed protein product [Medioppia subpectinata]|uniref:Uncharacterized protein n=1 Tax=Medioppia subpectinata TaxID=1979941 RepID=A0A7R9LZ16_9ACAR|nr:unnamed protein product [Medioppia subpectinata]CAG2122892.1 unnamed protein product [Medioppia subpectinata]
MQSSILVTGGTVHSISFSKD